MILVAEISLKLNWLPATGAKSFSVSPIDAIRHALLPGIAIAAYGMAEVARQLRGSLDARDDHGARFTITLPLPPGAAKTSRSFAPPDQAEF